LKSLICSVLMLNFLIVFSAESRVETSYGRAESVKTGELLYFEKHETDFREGSIESIKTQYFRPILNIKRFATLTSDFKIHPYLPDYTFEDSRFGRKDGVKNKSGGKSLETFARPKKDSELKTVTRAFDEAIVSGQGLHTYIHKNLNELLIKKNSTDILFLIPMNHKAYRFEIQRLEVTADRVVFKVKIKNWFLSMFAPSLKVTYDLKSKRLLVFEGASNINSDTNKTQTVKIVYSYDKPPKGMESYE